ncbi:MAG: hypothetical protein JSU06_03455 [Actinobacteria bacterium]|nr:hypothetical protein [Actinomycetota bacterium]
MTKTELESKHLADLHQYAAAAGIERYRMLTRAELIERLGDGEGDDGDAAPRGSDGEAGRERPRRRRRRASSGREREERVDVEDEEETPPDSGRAAPPPAERDEEDEEGPRPRRRRRRRRFGRRRGGVSIQDLLLPAESGRQVVLLADGREAATELLRAVAADLASASDGPDPVALLIDPSPEELADWKREAPQAELVSAGQARHATDALSQAQRRAADGEDVILLVDSLTRFTDSFGDADGAKDLFDAGRAKAASGKGSLTVVVALERG